jgi:hypothetical protein
MNHGLARSHFGFEHGGAFDLRLRQLALYEFQK